MATRVTALLTLGTLFCGIALLAWPRYCEDFELCYPACRVASNGIEYWKSMPATSGKSEWIAAEASPGSECLALLSEMQAKYPGRQVAIDYVNLANERKPAPFYQYDCTFDVKEPVFNQARNRECQLGQHDVD
jgi:hypothetical protein